MRCLFGGDRQRLDQRERQHGKVRLTNPADHVRIEIETALGRGIPVVPLLVQEADIPSPEQLPESLQQLAFRNGLPVRADPDFHSDVDRLIGRLERESQARPAPATVEAELKTRQPPAKKPSPPSSDRAPDAPVTDPKPGGITRTTWWVSAAVVLFWAVGLFVGYTVYETSREAEHTSEAELKRLQEELAKHREHHWQKPPVNSQSGKSWLMFPKGPVLAGPDEKAYFKKMTSDYYR